MNRYNEQYYIVFKKYDEKTLYLSSLQKTSDRDYTFKKMQFGQEPLFFNNAYKEKDKKTGVSREIKSAHLNINYPLVTVSIKEDLIKFENNNFQLYPAVIIDDSDIYHENFWFFNIFNKINVLNLKRCIIDDYDEDDKRHDIDKYYLDSNKLDAIPEEQRLVFIPEKASGAPVFLHQKIVDVFNKHKVDTLKFIKVSEWEMGKQF